MGGSGRPVDTPIPPPNHSRIHPHHQGATAQAVMEALRLTEAPLRTIGAVRQGTITIERLPVAEWEEKEAFRKQLGENIWGR